MNAITEKRAEILKGISYQTIAVESETVYQTVSKLANGGDILESKRKAIVRAAINIRSKQIDQFIEEVEILQAWDAELQ